MILAFDTYYYESKAKTVCIGFDKWDSQKVSNTWTEVLDNVQEYIPGEFYKRELPCIMSLLATIDLSTIECIIIDGFVYLDDNKKLGLGGHLYNSLNGTIPVIGVAKTDFISMQAGKKAIVRGKSNAPLFITSVGINVDDAAANVQSMYGEYRIPHLLKLLDGLTKQ